MKHTLTLHAMRMCRTCGAACLALSPSGLCLQCARVLGGWLLPGCAPNVQEWLAFCDELAAWHAASCHVHTSTCLTLAQSCLHAWRVRSLQLTWLCPRGGCEASVKPPDALADLTVWRSNRTHQGDPRDGMYIAVNNVWTQLILPPGAIGLVLSWGV